MLMRREEATTNQPGCGETSLLSLGSLWSSPSSFKLLLKWEAAMVGKAQPTPFPH